MVFGNKAEFLAAIPKAQPKPSPATQRNHRFVRLVSDPVLVFFGMNPRHDAAQAHWIMQKGDGQARCQEDSRPNNVEEPRAGDG